MIEADSVLSTPRTDSSSDQEQNVIQFAAFAVAAERRPQKFKTSTRVGEDIGDNLPEEMAFVRPKRPLPEPLTETCKNHRFRQIRREAWRKAETATRYWKARLDIEGAVGTAQSHGIPEGRLHPAVDGDDWIPMVDQYRKALARQLLTPAWDVASVTWKRAVLARRDYVIDRYVEAQRVQRAIDDDQAFLAAHPTKPSIRATKKPEPA